MKVATVRESQAIVGSEVDVRGCCRKASVTTRGEELRAKWKDKRSLSLLNQPNRIEDIL